MGRPRYQKRLALPLLQRTFLAAFFAELGRLHLVYVQKIFALKRLGRSIYSIQCPILEMRN
jgi:hypothetical protein